MPLFLAADLNNIPPFSKNNFDMSSLIIDIEIVNSQMKLLQQSQEASMSVHAAIFEKHLKNEPIRPPVNNIPNSPVRSVVENPQQQRVRHQQSLSPQAPPVPDFHAPAHADNIDENGGDPEDLLRLARNQGCLPQVSTPSGESIMLDTSYASVVRRGQLSQQRRSVADPTNRGNRYNPSIRDNYNEQRTVKVFEKCTNFYFGTEKLPPKF